MDKDRKTPDKNFSGVEFQNFPTDYHTWVCPIFLLEGPLQGGPEGLPKWEPRSRTVVYIGKPPLNEGSVALVLITRTGNFSLQYHVVFDYTFYTVEYMSRSTYPGNWKNLVEKHLELAMQKNFTLEKYWNLNEY